MWLLFAVKVRSRILMNVTSDVDCIPEVGAICGNFFEVVGEDMNLDGRMDLLISINSEVYGTLIVLEIPDDFR